MAKKTNQQTKIDPELAELEEKVDKMMSVELTEDRQNDTVFASSKPAVKKISIDYEGNLSDATTAPPLIKSTNSKKIVIQLKNTADEIIRPEVLRIDPQSTITSAPMINNDLAASLGIDKNSEDETYDELDKELTIAEVEEVVNAHHEPDFVSVREELSHAMDASRFEQGPVISENEAIDDIVAGEANAIMEIEDKQREALNTPLPKKTINKRFGDLLRSFIANKTRRSIILGIFFVSFVAVSVVPSSRYFVLNNFGVRSSSSIKVTDKKTLKPLQDVEIKIGNTIAKTDKNGVAKLDKVRLGPQEMQVKLPAFDLEKKRVTIGWGSNPLGDVQLNPRGSHYNFKFTDYLSGKSVNDIEVGTEDGAVSTKSNDKGEASLVIEDTNLSEIKVKISAEGYRVDTLTLDRNDEKIREHQVVPAKAHVFVSKRTGKYDLYAVSVDGKNEQVLLNASGSEKPDSMMVVPALKKNYVAFVTTRDNMRNKDGYLLSSLYIINADDKTNKVLAKSERIQVIGWFGSRLVYVKMTEGASAENTNRHKLMSYDIESGNDKELATANYFNDVVGAGDAVYYAPTSLKLDQGAIGLFKINPDGSGKQRLVPQETWNILRQSYDKLTVSLGSEWIEYAIDQNKTNRLSGAPATNDSKLYIDFDQTKSVVVDQRDGKGVVLLRERGKDEKEIKAGAGVSNPLYWLNANSLVYRVKNNTETADYAMSLNGGDAKKIADVTNTSGLDRWYYY